MLFNYSIDTHIVYMISEMLCSNLKENALGKNTFLSRELHEGAVLLNLKTRFERNLIYVSKLQSLLHICVS